MHEGKEFSIGTNTAMLMYGQQVASRKGILSADRGDHLILATDFPLPGGWLERLCFQRMKNPPSANRHGRKRRKRISDKWR